MTATVKPDFRIRLLIVGFALGLAACGNSGGDSGGDSGGGSFVADSSQCVPGDSATAEQCGSMIVTLTDVEGEFTSYTVDVLSIDLERSDGARFELLPQAVRVDFAQLTSLAELASASLLAPGEFVGGRIRIDYSDADIYLESGGNIVPAEVYAADGTLLTATTPDSVVEIEIALPDRQHLTATRGHTSLLGIDFDLSASHVVDPTTVPVSVLAQPYLVAEIEPIDTKELRVRGTLLGVDLASGTYDIRLRPWMHRFGDYGIVTVATHEATEFEIDGQPYLGADGLSALADQPTGTLTVAFGKLDIADRSFTADVVHAGDSLGGDAYSGVLGNIVSRSGDQLTIKGAVAIHRDRRAHFHRTVVVDVGLDTTVTKIGDSAGAFNKDDLSVGQRIMILGEFVNPEVEDTDRFGPDFALVLDATQGHARMLPTRLTGTVSRIVSGQINVRLRAIDRLGVALFDFAGTGPNPDLDADPMDYEIATSTLALDSIETLDTVETLRPVRVAGFVTSFGAAPPDFEGRLVTGPRDLPSVLGVGWGPDGTAAPFSAMGAESVVIDLANPDIGLRHHMLIGDRLVDLHDLPASSAIKASELPHRYGIWESGHVELFKDFADFVEELALRLSAADRARSLTAYGHYEAGENSLSAHEVVVHIVPADTTQDGLIQ